MNNHYIEKVALTFIEEKLLQILFKYRHPTKRTPPVGYKTEEEMRKCLNEIFNKDGIIFVDKKIRKKLILTADDFIKSGIKYSRSFVESSNESWSQCDIYAELENKPIMLGEIKTTTSANHNVCGLINKNLTSHRIFKLKPLSMVLYPDIKASTLLKNHNDIIKGLNELNMISEEEYYILKDCFFILTKTSWKNGLEKRTKNIQSFNPDNINLVIEENELLHSDDIDYQEWNRLINFVKS